MAWRYEASRAYSGGTGHYGKKHFKAGAGDIKTWLHAVTQIMVVTILYGFGTFLPVILRNGFNFTVKQAQYLVIPVNLWGAIVYAIGAWLSDKYNARFWVLVSMAPVGMLGYAILLAWNVPVGVQYFAVRITALTFTDPTNNTTDIPNLHSLLHLHRRQHRLALRQLRTGRQARCLARHPTHLNQPRRYCVWPDLPDSVRA